MGIEIERKFLLKSDSWRSAGAKGLRMTQGYFDTSGATVRVRVLDESAFLTIKGRPQSDGVRSEFEYAIPVADAQAMLKEFCGSRMVDKIRYCIEAPNDRVWEIDEYLGDNAGLFTAEIELDDINEPFDVPEWLGIEVTGDRRYTNGALSRCPYAAWQEK